MLLERFRVTVLNVVVTLLLTADIGVAVTISP